MFMLPIKKDTVRRKNLAPMSMQADHRASKIEHLPPAAITRLLDSNA
jgi:hypothetical protein